jgi:hypothetical protein
MIAGMAGFGAMETLSEQPERSASGTTDAIHILQAIFQETHFTTFPDGFVQLSRRAPISPVLLLITYFLFTIEPQPV